MNEEFLYGRFVVMDTLKVVALVAAELGVLVGLYWLLVA